MCSLPFLRLQTLELTGFATRITALGGGIGCAKLTLLTVASSDMDETRLNALLSHTPSVHTLELYNLTNLESLGFLSRPSLQRTLTHLSLHDCRKVRASELRHVYGLQQLTDLSIERSFSEKLDSTTLMDLQVPSTRLPKLRVRRNPMNK